jgi:tRNA 2-thiouridine synthesizing protein A
MTEIVMDLRGLKCPLPAECTDPLAAIDIPNLLRQTGDTLEGKEENGGVLTFRIRKK